MLLVKNIGTLVTPLGTTPARGEKQSQTLTLHNASVLCSEGKILEITSDGRLPLATPDTVVDARGRLVTPSLVDCHTHLVFGGWRAHELAKKLAGASYLDILKSGGGILDTVAHTREATEDELFERAKRFMDERISLGITTTEIKSGYGLDLENEKKQLRVIRRLGRECDCDVAATYMGAHATPSEFSSSDEYTDYICASVIPEISALSEFCDVFCENGAFNPKQSEKILKTALEHGLIPKIHTDEITPIGGTHVARSVGAISAEHLIAINDEGIDELAKSDAVAVLLPLTSLYLGNKYAPAKTLISRGISVAVATDFNPGSCPSLNLQLAMSVACIKYALTPAEVLCAVTLNAACAINRGKDVGTLEVGKKADMLIWDEDALETVVYRFGSNLSHTVIKNGGIVWNSPK